MIDEQTLRTYLAEVGAEISRGLGLEEVRITLEPVATPSAFERGETEIDWVGVLENPVRSESPPLEDHLPTHPFLLTRTELHLIHAGLTDVVGEGFRAYIQRSGRRPAIWRAFILAGPRGVYRLEFWRSD